MPCDRQWRDIVRIFPLGVEEFLNENGSDDQFEIFASWPLQTAPELAELEVSDSQTTKSKGHEAMLSVMPKVMGYKLHGLFESLHEGFPNFCRVGECGMCFLSFIFIVVTFGIQRMSGI